MKKSLFIALFVFIPLQIFSQITLQGKSIDKYVEEAMLRWKIPGMSVAVIEDGKVTFMKGYGVKELGKDDKVDENTLFAVASNSKAFTGLSIAMLESEGLLNLNDKVSKYIPEVKFYDANTTELLTIKDVLTHRVGLGTFQGDFITWGTNYSAMELIEKLQYVKPIYGFRSGYGYFNSGYTIAGEIIKRVTGKEWGEYVKENILNKLNMNRTLTSVSQLNGVENVATPHTVNYDYKMVTLPWRNVDNLAPAGAMISSARDMANWIIMQINIGEFSMNNSFPKKVILNTHTPYNLIPSPSHGTGRLTNRHFNTYGLGWGIGDYKNELYIEHSGGYDGMLSRTAFLPDRKFGLVILTNNDQNDVITTLMYQLFDYALNKDAFNWDSLSFANSTKDGISYDEVQWNEIRDQKNPDLKPSFQMSDLQGTYFNEQAGTLVISKTESELTFKLSSRPETGGVFKHWRNDTLICKFNDLVIGRCLAPVNIENGKIKSIKIKAADFVDPLYYEFYRKD